MSGLKKELVQLLAHYGHVGITFVASIFIGLGGGVYLDQKVFEGKTAPWFTFIGLAFGIAAGFKTLWDVLRRSTQEKSEDSDSESGR